MSNVTDFSKGADPARQHTVDVSKYTGHAGMAVQIDRLTIYLTLAQCAAFAHHNGVPDGHPLRLTIEPFNDPDNGGRLGLCLRYVTDQAPTHRSAPASVGLPIKDRNGAGDVRLVQFTSNQAPFITGILPAFTRISQPARIAASGALIFTLPDIAFRQAPRQHHGRLRAKGLVGTVAVPQAAPPPAAAPATTPGALTLDDALAAAAKAGMRLTVSPSGAFTFSPAK